MKSRKRGICSLTLRLIDSSDDTDPFLQSRGRTSEVAVVYLASPFGVDVVLLFWVCLFSNCRHIDKIKCHVFALVYVKGQDLSYILYPCIWENA